MTMLADRLVATQKRLGLSDEDMAAYLGARKSSYRNWIEGDRGVKKPDKQMIRLLDVLEAIEIMAPAIHEALMPGRKS